MKKLAWGVCVLGLLVGASAFAKPRPAWPPFPEGQLAQWRFDATNKVQDNVFNAEGYTLVESWSGYALQMSGSAPRRLIIPVLKESGRLNVAPAPATIRF